MAIKLIKRTKPKDVFAKLVETQGDPPSAETVENIMHAADSEMSEEADSAPSVEDADTVEAQDDDTDGADEQPSTPSRRKRWLRRFIVGTAGVIFVAALGFSGFSGWQLKQQKEVDDAGRAALAAAQGYAVALTSIETNSVDKNFAEVVDGSTGEFKDMYSQSASQLRQVLIDNKAMSKGVVVDSAIKSATKTKVEVVLFIDQWISNVVSPQPRMDRNRVAMTMELIDGRWLASNVELK
jgi:Mce-associated membrane protein